jgi:uncharacterized protein YcfJ
MAMAGQATLLGAVGGGYAGNAIEGNMKSDGLSGESVRRITDHA